MGDKSRAARDDLSTNFGEHGMIGSDGSQEAADAWYSVLTEGEEHVEDDAAGESPDDEEQDDLEPDEDESDEDESDEGAGEDDDPDEDDEDDEEESDEDDEDDDAKDVDPETKVKVKVDGEEVEVTLKELQDGYSRTQDYTRKTQQLAEERRQLESGREEVLQQQQQWSQLLDGLKPRLQAQLSGRSEEDWAKLKAQDELTYYEEREKERATQQRIEAIQQEQARVQQEQQQYQLQQLQKWAREERDALFSKVPEWTTDPEIAKRETAEMKQYGTEIGFSEEELGNVIDHRMLLALRDAAKYRALQKVKSSGRSKVTRKAKPLKPGTPSNETSKRAKARKSKQRLAKTKTVDAAVPYFANLLDNE